MEEMLTNAAVAAVGGVLHSHLLGAHPILTFGRRPNALCRCLKVATCSVAVTGCLLKVCSQATPSPVRPCAALLSPRSIVSSPQSKLSRRYRKR